MWKKKLLSQFLFMCFVPILFLYIIRDIGVVLIRQMKEWIQAKMKKKKKTVVGAKDKDGVSKGKASYPEELEYDPYTNPVQVASSEEDEEQKNREIVASVFTTLVYNVNPKIEKNIAYELIYEAIADVGGLDIEGAAILGAAIRQTQYSPNKRSTQNH